MFDVEKRVLELVYSKYVLKFRNNMLNKRIKDKCSEEYKKRREINNSIKILKEQLLIEQDIEKIKKIQNELKELYNKLNDLENEISKKCKIELEMKEKLKEKSKEIDRELRKIFKGIIPESEIKQPIDEAIKQNNPDLVTIILLKSNEGLKPEPKVVEISPASVPGKGGGG